MLLSANALDVDGCFALVGEKQAKFLPQMKHRHA